MLFVGGSVGNEDLIQKYSQEIGSDVVAICALNAIEVTPVKDQQGKVIATDFVYMLDTDVSGSLPDLVKRGIGQAQTNSLDNIVGYIKKHYQKS